MTTSPYESLSYSKWDCKYHLMFIPKGRKKELADEDFRTLDEAGRKASKRAA